ncbi:cupin domain-containing protein [Pantoea sp. EA-12]|uniref:cupin domain-containing protein n=1 Tax=Pantoea sp. EA-12 TaxID=3043303 RepID=UPI0024B56001|nr:cupin domain-containing protein [Pantoea sp. EA-12]MDI9222109.1 cupin domain-containing protein [Pantoea sp. EA-12]
MANTKNESKENQHSVEHVLILQSGCAWNGQVYEEYPAGKPQISVMRMSLPPHSELPWHTHPMPNTAYILSGELTIEDKMTGLTRCFKSGQAVNETINSAHRGYTSELHTELVIFYAGVDGLELSESLPGEAPEF